MHGRNKFIQHFEMKEVIWETEAQIRRQY